MQRLESMKVERVLNCLPSQDQEQDWMINTARESGLYAAAALLPESVDLREPWWGIGNQTSTGACVGWAISDSVLRWHLVKAGRLPQDKTLSVRFVWMAAKEQDEQTSRPTTFVEREGTTLKAGLTVVQKYGVVPDDFLPIDSGSLYQGSADVLYAVAAKFRVTAYFNLRVHTESWREWLFNNGPILARIDVDDNWMDAKKLKGKLNKYNDKIHDSNSGHAIALVGYTSDTFIVRNSWGSGWGDKGYGYLSLEYALQAINESYGVVL